MDNQDLMNKLAALPAPDFIHTHQLSDPIGSGSSHRADTVVRLIDEAVKAERMRCAKDSEALNWIERQHLEELGMGLVIDAPNDGKYYVRGDSGTTHYGKTLREALASAMAEGA